jgi:hypothetical protein
LTPEIQYKWSKKRNEEDAIMAGQDNVPNRYELTGRDTEITYSTTSFGGQPQLIYCYQAVQHTFSGAEIRSLDTEIGQQVTVTIEEIPDLHSITLTLLIPAINLDGVESPFRTRAIFTTRRSSIGGPRLIKGALQLYRVLALRGVARIVEF